jgi:hypothetical protein
MLRRTIGVLATAALAAVIVGACSSSDTSSVAGDAATGASSSSASASVSSSSVASSSSSSTGAGGGGGGAPFPLPSDIGFAPGADFPAGELLVFNDWNAIPNTLSAVPIGGGAATVILSADTLWSVGVARTSRKVAFSAGFSTDVQLAHYGVDIGSAIEPSWLYDPSTREISQLSDGNLNDECHLFSQDEQTLYLCRRYDFTETSNKGYRVGKVDMSTLAFTFLTADLPDELDFHPAVDAAETSLLFGAVLIQGTTQSRQIDALALPSGSPSVALADADAPVFSPDFSKVAFTNYGDAGALYVASPTLQAPVKIATEGGDEAAWSPDGTRVAYLVFDDALGCSHIHSVAADGSEADAPTTLRDCGATGEFITTLAWLPP